METLVHTLFHTMNNTLDEPYLRSLLRPLIESLIEGHLILTINKVGSSSWRCDIFLEESDRAKVIGKGGRVINGLRSFFIALGGKYRSSIILEIIE